MNCNRCGNIIKPSDKFCATCGNAIVSDNTNIQVQPEVVQETTVHTAIPDTTVQQNVFIETPVAQTQHETIETQAVPGQSEIIQETPIIQEQPKVEILDTSEQHEVLDKDLNLQVQLKGKSKKNKVLLFIIIVGLVCILGFLGYMIIDKNKNDNNQKENNKVVEQEENIINNEIIEEEEEFDDDEIIVEKNYYYDYSGYSVYIPDELDAEWSYGYNSLLYKDSSDNIALSLSLNSGNIYNDVLGNLNDSNYLNNIKNSSHEKTKVIGIDTIKINSSDGNKQGCTYVIKYSNDINIVINVSWNETYKSSEIDGIVERIIGTSKLFTSSSNASLSKQFQLIQATDLLN